MEQKIILNFAKKTERMEPLKIIRNESSFGRLTDVSGAFKVANQQAYSEGRRKGQVEGMQREISRIKEFIEYLEILQKRYKSNQTILKIKEYYQGELENFKIKNE